MPSSRHDQQVIARRPEWDDVRVCAEDVELSDQQKKEILGARCCIATFS